MITHKELHRCIPLASGFATSRAQSMKCCATGVRVLFLEAPHAEWLALLLDREAANRNTRRFQIRLRSAKLRQRNARLSATSANHIWRSFRIRPRQSCPGIIGGEFPEIRAERQYYHRNTASKCEEEHQRYDESLHG